MSNYFSYETAAQRYAAARPYFHPLVIEKIRAYLQIKEPVSEALDIACGTGRSTQALTEIAQHVVGTDQSHEMLLQTNPNPRITYLQASAEDLPFENDRFDLLSVSLAFHWFDRARFLAEANRVLRPLSWLIIYNNAFSGQMCNRSEFAQWHKDIYLKRYPSPIRHGHPLTHPEASQHGFRFVHQEDYTNDIAFSVDTLAHYLMTQSNIIATIEEGEESAADVFAWLTQELTPFFETSTATFIFSGYLWYLQKADFGHR